MPPSSFALSLAEIAHEAGHVVLKHYRAGVEAQFKADASPVTAADREAEMLILQRLAILAPGVPVIAEEESQAGGLPRLAPERFFLVDPLDGTREFLKKNDEFTVNIALIKNGNAVCGVVLAPALHRLYLGEKDKSAFAVQASENVPLAAMTPIQARRAPPHGLTALVSRSHKDEATEAYLSQFTIAERTNAGSSLKFCLLAEGRGDLYPRFGNTMEWDTAAGQAVLEAAGGSVQTLDGKRLVYGKAENRFLNPAFVARGAA